MISAVTNASQSESMLSLCLPTGTPFTCSRLDDEQWKKGLANGLIHPGMKRGEATALWYKSSRQKRHRSIDAENLTASRDQALPRPGFAQSPSSSFRSRLA